MRQTTTFTIVQAGVPLDVTVIESPTIDDVMVSEAKIQAYSIATGTDISDHTVDRSVRDLLLRMGVER
jgi:hypothetical protein